MVFIFPASWNSSIMQSIRFIRDLTRLVSEVGDSSCSQTTQLETANTLCCLSIRWDPELLTKPGCLTKLRNRLRFQPAAEHSSTFLQQSFKCGYKDKNQLFIFPTWVWGWWTVFKMDALFELLKLITSRRRERRVRDWETSSYGLVLASAKF